MKAPWSPLAERANRTRDVRGRRDNAFQIILHTTGRGVYYNAGKVSDAALSAAVSYYTAPGNAFAHYVIGHCGTIVQIASEAEKAWQAAWQDWEAATYSNPNWIAIHDGEDCRWWARKWTLCNSPLGLTTRAMPQAAQLRATRAPTPNGIGIGVELLWHPKHITDAQYDACARLVLDISRRRKIALLPYPPAPELLGHEDVCPARRTTKGKPWDPGTQLDWARLWDTLCDVAPDAPRRKR